MTAGALATIAIVSSIAIGVTLYLADTSGAALSALTRDAVAVLGGRWYIGELSSLTSVAWTTGAAMALLAASVARRVPGVLREARFLRHAGVLTALLMFDDLLLFHERWGQRVLHTSEIVIEVAWLVAGVALVVVHRDILLRGGVFVLSALAFVLLGLSTGLDVLLPKFTELGFDTRQAMEDVPKFCGALAWSVLLATYSYVTLRALTREPGQPGSAA